MDINRLGASKGQKQEDLFAKEEIGGKCKARKEKRSP